MSKYRFNNGNIYVFNGKDYIFHASYYEAGISASDSQSQKLKKIKKLEDYRFFEQQRKEVL